MLLYLLKRLLLIIPTVWLIGSLVFLLSRLIPGTHADVVAEVQEASLGGAGKSIDRKIYLAQLQQQGLDKPLFYFSVTNLAQPDTLYRVFPERHQSLLQNLLQQYGNWPYIVAYYQSLNALQTRGRLNHNQPLSTNLSETINACLAAQNFTEVAAVLAAAGITKGTQPEIFNKVQKHFTVMQANAQPYRVLIPDWRWHGSRNQYHAWFINLLQGNLGYSYRDQQPVLNKIKEAVGNTLVLLITSLVLTFCLSIELSLLLCRWQKGKSFILNLLYILDSIPMFLLALVLLTFLLGTRLLDPAFVFGAYDAGFYAPDNIFAVVQSQVQQLWLPALCLILTSMPYITTQLYHAMQSLLRSEFIKAARAKGLSEQKVLRRHAFRNALLTLITLFTGYLPVIISGAVVIEVIFVIPGSGVLLRDSVLARDYPVVIGLVLFLALLKAGAHVLADALYFAADPRTRSNPA